jgi:excisionase family DNA binding protein
MTPSGQREIVSDWLTKREAAAYAQVSTRTIERAIAAQQLQAAGTAGLVRLRVEWLDYWLTRRGENPPPGLRVV